MTTAITSDLIPLSVPLLGGNEWRLVKDCLDSGWVSSAGKYVDLFEREIAHYTGSQYAVACVNGTSALHVALRVAGVVENDEVIVPALTFIAPVNAVRYLAAVPVFMDCDRYYNMDVEKTIEFIIGHTRFADGRTWNKKTGRRISAIVPVHVFGNAVNLERLVELCHDRGIVMVEDATESLGTVYTQGRLKDKHAGTIGSLGCLSFNGNKIITTGGGGMILTSEAEYAARARYLTTQAKDDEIRYVHNEVGYNFRMTNIQAALGVAQLELLPTFLTKKKHSYEVYKAAIDAIPGLHLAETPPYANNNRWMYALQIENGRYGKDREGLMKYLSSHNVQTRPVWQLNHLQKPYKDAEQFKISTAVELVEKTLNIPCSTNLLDSDIRKVVGLLNVE